MLNRKNIRLFTLLFFLSLYAFSQKSYNSFVGVGGRVNSDVIYEEKPLNVVFAYRLAHLPNGYEILPYFIAESNFMSFHGIGLGFRVNYLKTYFPKTVYFILDAHVSYFPIPSSSLSGRNTAFGAAGLGYMLSKRDSIELGILVDWDTFLQSGEDLFLRISYVHSFNIPLKRDKKFKQNPKKQLECPKIVGL